MDESFGGHSVGEQFSNKELLSYAGKNKYNQHLWNWQCLLCSEAHGPSIVAKIKRSRKCQSKSCSSGSMNRNWSGYEEISGSFLYQYRSDAEKKNRKFSVSAEYLWALWVKQAGLCVYSGLQLRHGIDASIDRVDSSLGYVEGNVQWVHRDVNRMKTDFTEQHFLYLCSLIAGGDRRFRTFQ